MAVIQNSPITGCVLKHAKQECTEISPTETGKRQN